jgi:hypothetical protein
MKADSRTSSQQNKQPAGQAESRTAHVLVRDGLDGLLDEGAFIQIQGQRESLAVLLFE